jgi:hypothetical protein
MWIIIKVEWLRIQPNDQQVACATRVSAYVAGVDLIHNGCVRNETSVRLLGGLVSQTLVFKEFTHASAQRQRKAIDLLSLSGVRALVGITTPQPASSQSGDRGFGTGRDGDRA